MIFDTFQYIFLGFPLFHLLWGRHKHGNLTFRAGITPGMQRG